MKYTSFIVRPPASVARTVPQAGAERNRVDVLAHPFNRLRRFRLRRTDAGYSTPTSPPARPRSRANSAKAPAVMAISMVA